MPLPAAAAAELARLEARLGQAADAWARAQLEQLGDDAAVRVLRDIGKSSRPVRNLSAYVKFLANKETMERNASGIPTAESAACCSGPFRASPQDDSISGPLYQENVQMEIQSPDGEMAFDLTNQARIEPVSTVRTDACAVRELVGMEVESPPGWTSPGWQNKSPFSAVGSPMANRGRTEARCLGHQMPLNLENHVQLQAHSPVRDFTPSPVREITKRVQLMDGPSGRTGMAAPPALSTVNALRQTASPQMLALGELEFDRVFLIYVYLANKKIEEVLEDVNYIWHLKSLPMDVFESEIWNKFGKKFLPASDRRKNLDWDPSKTRLYHCNVEQRDDSIVTTFKGPYVEDTRTHLQKVVGDDNVLIVKFADIEMCGHMNNADKFGIYCLFYNQVAQHGILLGLRRYRFFIYKDGGKEEKQKEANKKERGKKCIPSVRCYFVCTESGWDRDEPYILNGYTVDQARRRFMHIHNAPTVSKYLARFALILSKTFTLKIDLSKVNVTIIEDIPCKDEDGNIIMKDGEPLIHTDGTGLISFDLAEKCPTSVFMGNLLKAHELQDTVDSKKRQYLQQYPLLIQFRMFYNGQAVKGTLLVDKRLPENTIHIRPSMIKIHSDLSSSGGQSFNSLEVVTTSNRPRNAVTSRLLIALLRYRGVKAEYFLELLGKALEDITKARHKARDWLEVASNHADMDDFMSARMILSGIEPKDEAYLQSQLALMTKVERKGLQQGKIPIDDCYYLMGTTDPTGTLKREQVCVIHDNGQVSGEVLVYKHPGLHFGDIHRLTATRIDGLEKIVGNSRYAIFFPTCGPRSLADEMANSDFDGDMYWVSWNPQLLEQFERGEVAPWEERISLKKTEQKKPQDYVGLELESLLFCYAMGTAANCWLALMDRLLTPGVSESEKKSIKPDMLDLVDYYYLALDASKKGNKITIPENLIVKQYPHFMEREHSYQSTSVLGKIYDEAKSQQSEAVPPISIVPLKCFTEVAVSECYKRRWKHLYRNEYLQESSSLCNLVNKEQKNFKFRELYQKYKKILYEAEEYEQSPKNRLELFNEACAVYQVVYQYAMECDQVSKCGFAWKVAGEALCELYVLNHGGPRVTCSRAVLEDAFRKNRA
ncbi:hypothetical protein ACP70R_030976 [Stipagrostis hirtigluma subsp. patula]